MKVILKEDIANLGYKDDVVEVKNGYGRNYLIPQKKAVIASESALKVLAENLKQRAHKIAKADHRCKDKCNRHHLWFGKQHPDCRCLGEARPQYRPQDDIREGFYKGSWQLHSNHQTAQRSVG